MAALLTLSAQDSVQAQVNQGVAIVDQGAEVSVGKEGGTTAVVIEGGGAAGAGVAGGGSAVTVAGDDVRVFGHTGLPTFLKAYDSDHDNLLSYAEQSAMQDGRYALSEKRIAEFDMNQDGSLSALESMAARKKLDDHVYKVRINRFTEADLNNDGVLSFAEFTHIDSINELYQTDPTATRGVYDQMTTGSAEVTFKTFIYAINASELQSHRNEEAPIDIPESFQDIPKLFGHSPADGLASFGESTLLTIAPPETPSAILGDPESAVSIPGEFQDRIENLSENLFRP